MTGLRSSLLIKHKRYDVLQARPVAAVPNVLRSMILQTWSRAFGIRYALVFWRNGHTIETAAKDASPEIKDLAKP